MFFLFFLIIQLIACTSASKKESNISITQARLTPDAVRGQKVHWGGSLISTNNHKNYSLVEVLGRPLQWKEPDDRHSGKGRFLVKINGFVDPIDYSNPNRITVTGQLDGIYTQKIGDYLYTYPVVIANSYKLWRGNYKEHRTEPYWPYWGWPGWHPYCHGRLFPHHC